MKQSIEYQLTKIRKKKQNKKTLKLKQEMKIHEIFFPDKKKLIKT